MGQALYRKYRSKNLAEIVGQEHITVTLDNALKKGAISHAYLFTGPRGVGKTSIARILAHEVNGLPYDESASHLDIIEIDAASNRGIEEIRELRSKAFAAPASAKYKVYIIDEVHMLTTPAFNALLKTLEEPPAHVMFIMATTEAHKLPETIVSRTQRFTFRPIDETKVVKHLKTIAKQEKITVSDDALRLIAQHGGGSFRDSISLLDQASSTRDKIELDDVLQLLGIAPASAISQLLDNTLSGTPAALLGQLSDMREQGFHASGVAKQLGSLLRQRLIENQLAVTPLIATNLLRQLLSVPAAHDPEALLEITLLGTNLELNNANSQASPAPMTHAPQPVAPHQTKLKKPEERLTTATVPKPDKKSENADKIVQSAGSSSATTMDIWPQVLDTIKQRHNTLYSVLRMAQPTVETDSLTLSFAFAFHQKKINESKSRQIISDIIQQLTGQPVTVVCVVEKNAKPPKPPLKAAPDPSFNTISNIFGGAEVLE